MYAQERLSYQGTTIFRTIVIGQISPFSLYIVSPVISESLSCFYICHHLYWYLYKHDLSESSCIVMYIHLYPIIGCQEFISCKWMAWLRLLLITLNQFYLIDISLSCLAKTLNYVYSKKCMSISYFDFSVFFIDYMHALAM